MENGSKDVRFGHDLRAMQDESGVDLLLLREQLKLSVEERFRRLEEHAAFIENLRGAASR